MLQSRTRRILCSIKLKDNCLYLHKKSFLNDVRLLQVSTTLVPLSFREIVNALSIPLDTDHLPEIITYGGLTVGALSSLLKLLLSYFHYECYAPVYSYTYVRVYVV